MKRIALLAFLVALAFAQNARDGYREAYRQWRQRDPSLERDAGSAKDLAARAALVAQDEVKFSSARATFLNAAGSRQVQQLAWLDTPPDAPSPMTSESTGVLLAGENRLAKRSMDTFATDPDPGIRELRSMLARESAAADALSAAMEKRKRVAEGVKSANTVVAESQLKSGGLFHGIEQDIKDATDEQGREAAAWSQYYALLGNARTGEPATAPPPAPVAAPRTMVTPLPLVRYTGAWTFPSTGGLYHGPEPASVEVMVHEQNGRADGTLSGRFKVPRGTDPELRFGFTGDFTNTRTQSFKVTTADGATGFIELIPGTAFNLLEVNFLIDAKPGKIRQGNLVLVKK